MKVLFFALSVLFPPSLLAQVTMKDGKILVNSELLCHYQEGERKANDAKHHSSPVFSQISEDFRDVYFTAPADGFTAVAMEARVLAHARLAYLTHYYSIRFFATGHVINIAYKPLRMEAFVKDLASFGIFRNGSFSPDNIPALVQKWRARDGILEDEIINTGVSESYVSQGTESIQDSVVSNILVRNGNIYRGDSVIAHYKEGPPLDPRAFARHGNKTYYISDLSGKHIMVLSVGRHRSQVYALLVSNQQEFTFITPDKSEARLIRAATGFLMLLHAI